ncbi:hypothetical protein Tco_0981675, partial [Tanacetum coccineum]
EVDDDQEATKIKELMKIVSDEEEVAIDAIPLATKPPIISSVICSISFDREDLETLWKLIKAKYGSTRTVEDLDLILWGDLKIMFEPHVEDRGRIVGIKSFLMLFRITLVLIDVNAAQSKLVLLENFNENYSKCLKLLVKLQLLSTKLVLLEEVTTASGINAAEGVNAASKEVSTAKLVSTVM